MPALYRQYRPQTFSEIIGQNHITYILGQAILNDKVAHAYLFQGPRGTGKTTTARIFSKRLNCTASETVEPCGSCNSCVAFQKKASLDMMEIDAASNRGIDDIRALRETASLSPSSGKYKIYIIDEVHMLSGPAFAALLKTLEEPPKHVIFILATTELHKVPATIASRCQLFRFRRATDEEMKTRLTHILHEEKRTADDDLITFISQRSDGCYRDAESLLGQLLSHSEDTLTVAQASDLLGIPSPKLAETFLEALVAGDAQQAVTIATKAYADGFDTEQFLHESVRAAREGIIRAITQNNPPAFASAPNALDRITVIMRAFLVALQDISYVPEPMIALELAILTSCAGVKRQAAPAPSLPQQPKEERRPPVVQVDNTPAPAMVIKNDSPELFVKIQTSWEQVVQSLRKVNPVASTFLRATQPKAVVDGALVLHMQFPLHKTFFDKPDNMKLVQQALMQAIGESLHIKSELNAAPPVSQEEKNGREEDLLKNIQEVFGVKVQ